mgnify:CR=1 FL=1
MGWNYPLGPVYAVFHGQDAGCFEIDGGIVDHKNHLMTEKTPNNDHLYERSDNFCISGLPVTSVRPCPRSLPLLPLALGPVTIKPYKERLAWRAYLLKVTIRLEWCWMRDVKAIGRKSWPLGNLGYLKCNKMRCHVLRKGRKWQWIHQEGKISDSLKQEL